MRAKVSSGYDDDTIAKSSLRGRPFTFEKSDKLPNPPKNNSFLTSQSDCIRLSHHSH